VILQCDAIKLLPTFITFIRGAAKPDLQLWLVWGEQAIVCTVED
jgi:hypothetical protein